MATSSPAAAPAPQSAPSSAPLLEAREVHKSFPLPDGKGVFTVLEKVSVHVQEKEIVALLGRSGSGKSTLLRILCGLIPPSGGEVWSSGQRVTGPNPDIAMVFQSFALLPWLTVQENAELGLEALGVPPKERRKRALKLLDLVGLDGFETAYPKELSGGMKQRVGFARALVKEPKILFMDEPFSALDVLTAENLRGELSSLWEGGNFPAQSVLIVTHNIEEAVFFADRVVILGANPGRIRGEMTIDLPRPRQRHLPRFQEYVDTIYTVMTDPNAKMEDVVAESEKAETTAAHFPPLPHARAGGISGLLEIVEDHGEVCDIHKIAHALRFNVDDLLPILDAATLLGFAHVEKGDVTLTPEGREFAGADILRSKEIFAKQSLEHVPQLAQVVDVLKQKKGGAVRADFFLDILDEHYPRQVAEAQFETLVDWGRYAELFEYDAAEDYLRLADAQGAVDEEIS